MSLTNRLNGQTLYGLIILIVIASIALTTSVSQWQKRRAQQEALQNSRYWQPQESFGVWCTSEVDVRQPAIPFNFWIQHPPGNREVLDETIRQLGRSGIELEPWPEEVIRGYVILETHCANSWSDVYQVSNSTRRREIHAFLRNPEQPSEADLRQAILRAAYERMGTAEKALELFPPAED